MTFKDFFIDGKKVKDLYVNGKKAKMGEPIPENMLGFKAVDGSVGLSLATQGEPAGVSLQKSLDGDAWTSWNFSEITIPEGSTLYVRRADDNPNNTFSESTANYYKFVMTGTGKIEAQGSVQYLLGKSGTRTDAPTYCYRSMFSNCTALTQAPELPATTLASSCYDYMFDGCTSLTEAPELPATTLASSCYGYMFRSCTSLTEAPELPATTLAGNCYNSMFRSCTSLTQAPALSATNLANGCYNAMFLGCTSLAEAPELPATTLKSGCYNSMFQNCTALTQAPELPAMTLIDNCYNTMFMGCTSLTEAPALPATTLALYCYSGMFSDCTSLTQAPALPATTLGTSCYNAMFQSTALTTAPELPATTLTSGCYGYMFRYCTSLTTAPELPATTLNSSCYQYMFDGCTSLTTAPELPATTLASSCYSYMFQGCSSLNSMKVAFTAWGSQTNNWLKNVASTGTFTCPQALIDATTTRGTSTVPVGWNMVAIQQILNFKAVNGSVGLRLTKQGSPDSVSLETNLDDAGWTSWDLSEITIPEGSTLYVRRADDNPANGFSKNDSNRYKFATTGTGKLEAQGSVQYLLGKSGTRTDVPNSAFNGLFMGCTGLKKAPELPAMTLGVACYEDMFRDATSMSIAPTVLPATTITTNSYDRMFPDNPSLTHAPEIMVAANVPDGMNYMFSGCTNLIYAKVHFTSWSGGFNGWFKSISTAGTFHCPQALINATTTRGQSTVPSSWTMQALPTT